MILDTRTHFTFILPLSYKKPRFFISLMRFYSLCLLCLLAFIQIPSFSFFLVNGDSKFALAGLHSMHGRTERLRILCCMIIGSLTNI